MTNIHTQHTSSSSYPCANAEKIAVSPIGSTPFSMLFQEQSQQTAQQTASMYAATTETGSEEQRRHNHYIPGKLFDTIRENRVENSVNSVGNSSEKCQAPGTHHFSDDETTKQQYSQDSSASGEGRNSKKRNGQTQQGLTHRNNSELCSTAMGHTSTNNSVSMAAEVSMAMPSEQMKKLVRVLRNSNLSKRASVFLTLDLNELGEVKLDVTLKAKKVFITAYVADRRAAAALSFALGELKKQLATIDLTLEHFEVSTGRRPTGNVKDNSAIDATVAIN